MEVHFFMSEKGKQKKPLLAVQIAKVIVFFICITALAFCAAAYCTVRNDFSESTTAFLALFCAGISVLATGFVAGKIFKRAEMLSGIAVGISGFILLVLLALWEGQTSFSVNSVIRFLLLVSCGGLGGFLTIASNEKKRKPRR